MTTATVILQGLAWMWISTVTLFTLALIICRRGCQKYLDPIYLNVGTMSMFARDNSMAILTRTMLYIGASLSQWGRDRHFEGRDPRKDMPLYLRRWTVICFVTGLLQIFVAVTAVVFALGTSQATFWEIFGSRYS